MTDFPASRLSDLHNGEQAFITSLGHGMGINSRLTSLGFTPGVPVIVMQNYGHGPLVVSVRGTRIALGRGEANKIAVQKAVK